MTSSNHTYGPTCHLSHTVLFPGLKGDDDIPPLKAQYFYSSPLPIDDPLTAIPTPNSSESKTSKSTPRPFPAYDNNALEEAWLGLASEKERRYHHKVNDGPPKVSPKGQADLAAKHNRRQAKDGLTKDLNRDRDKERVQNNPTKYSTKRCQKCNKSPEICTCAPKEECCTAGPSASKPSECVHPSSKNPNCCSELEKDGKVDHRNEVEVTLKKHDSGDILVQDGLSEAMHQTGGPLTKVKEGKRGLGQRAKKINFGWGQGDAADDILFPPGQTSNVILPLEKNSPGNGPFEERHSKQHKVFEKHQQSKEHKKYQEHLEAEENGQENAKSGKYQHKEREAIRNHQQSQEHIQYQEHLEADHARQLTDPSTLDSKKSVAIPSGSSDAGTTGFPFKRAPPRRTVAQSKSGSPSPSARGDGPADWQPDDFPDGSDSMASDSDETLSITHCKAHKNGRGHVEVPVGVSRLHLVKLPALQMMPIYWSPVHDIAAVTRGTWFYKDTMLPVEPAAANQLEMGYRELRPWSQTWLDELKCALEVGAAGEEKISHRLWPKDTEQKGDRRNNSEKMLVATNPHCAARCFHGEVAAAGRVDAGHQDEKSSQTTELTKRFPNSHVIYKDSHNAFILKPSLQASEYYGRKPLAKIKKGTTVGIHVVRGFSWKAWDQLHPTKKSAAANKAEEAAPVAENAHVGKIAACAACLKHEERPKVTDLVLVIHGIGQKLSERIESFHFTHSINAFRRSVNVELGNDAVRNVFRKDLGGIMVLPVNWRSNLKFEDGGPMTDQDRSNGATASDFTLKDITPETIPAVRNLISDVMLDIPFYMSHHKPKMIEALITEANRVYRLWCQNNPEFDKTGRVHIIAHSLGSAMALDVLSKQPTSVPNVNLRKKMSTKNFEFDTKNLFFAGSPAGFFLLLEKGKLLPRKGRNKLGSQPGDDDGKDIAGDAGTFGCLAVDNLFNIIHYNDPIAYRLNGAVDPLYASTFKNAQVPSATTSWLEAIGNAMRSIKPGGSPALEPGVGQMAKPSVARLPSQLEMEVHDFSREEISEKMFYLLNDNGQIDYFLSSGGGPLEIQYLNMLSAHSNYWINPDFVRMLVTEIGRKPGRSNTLPNMRVVKVGH